MGKNFKRFKVRARGHAVTSSLLIGLGIGVLFIAVSMLIFKLSGSILKPIFYPLGIGLAVLISATLYFVFNPSDKRLAKRLDSIYGLNEKISTMVEFSDNPGSFYGLQRTDAEEKLGTVPIKAMKSRTLLSGIITLAVATGIMITAVSVPVKAESEDPIDEFDKQWILASLDEIIVMVRSNEFMNAALREHTLDELTLLVEFVNDSSLFSEMKAEAIKKIISIDTALDKTNTAVAIGEKFRVSTDEKLVNLGNKLTELSSGGTKNAIIELGEALMSTDYNSISFTASEINSYISASGAPIDDPIYIIFKTLTSEMQNGSMGDIESAIESASKNIVDKISIQNVNASAVSKAIKGVCDLFGITQSDLDSEGVDVTLPDRDAAEQEPEIDDEKKEPDASMGSGGLGTGDVIYGSNDMIFDPNRNTYVPYGVLINEYFAKVNEQVTDGKVSDEAAKLFDLYFGILFGNDTEENSN